MNFKEILNYRSQCLICQSAMVNLCDGSSDQLKETPEGFLSKSGNTLLKYDGTFVCKSELWRNIQDLSVDRVCSKCKLEIKIKSRSVGCTTLSQTTLNNIRDRACGYRFTISLSDDKTYNIYLDKEFYRYHNDQEFYHIDTDFINNISHLTYGKFKDKVEDVKKLTLPKIDLSNIKDMNQYIDKMRLYIVFS